MKKRFLCVLLACIIVAGSFVSCSNNDSGTNTDSKNQSQSNDTAAVDVEDEENLTDYELRQRIPDNLPDIRFDGKEFRIAVCNETQADYLAEIVVEEITGDACNDAIYNRNIKVEDRFDCVIYAEAQADSYNLPKTMATSGTADFHMVGMHDYQSYYSINATADLNWLDVPYVNLSQPWHNSLANDDATVNGYLFTICSDLSTTSMTFTHAMFTNLDLLAEYGYSASDVYGVVNEGKWTLDYFNDFVSSMYIDENGNGKADKDDRYGFGYQITNPADVWFTAFGGKVTGRDEEGRIIMTFMSEKTSDMITKLMNLHYNNPGVEILATQYDEEPYFKNQKLVIAPMRFYVAYSLLRDMDATYTMLPYPKWDEAQQEYYTNADDKFTVFALPTTSYSELDFIGVVFEALCAESYKLVYPEFYDTALKGKYSSDQETAGMVDLIMAGRMFDFSFQFGETVFQNTCYFIRKCLGDKDENIASRYKKIEKALNKQMEKNFNKAYHYDD